MTDTSSDTPPLNADAGAATLPAVGGEQPPTQITHHRFGGPQAIGLCLIVALAIVAGSAMLQPSPLAEDVERLRTEQSVSADNAFLKDRQDSNVAAGQQFERHDQAGWARDALGGTVHQLQSRDQIGSAPEANAEPPVGDEELAEAATLRETVDVLSLVNPVVLLGLLKRKVVLYRGHIAKIIRTPNTLLVDRTFAHVDQSSRQQIDNFLAAFQYNPHAQEQGYIAGLKRARAEFTSIKHIISCGKCWCTVVDDPLTD